MTLKKLLEEATEGELYVVKEHDLWCAIYRGHGLGKRLVADCLRDGDARLIVYLVNHAAAFAELVEAVKVAVSALKARMDNEGLPHKDDDLIHILAAALRRVEG